MPKSVFKAIYLMLLSSGLSVVIGIFSFLTKNIDAFEFLVSIIFTGLYLILPYKISVGSKGWYYIYFVLYGISVLGALIIISELKNFFEVLDYLQALILSTGAIIFLLKKDSKRWLL